MIYKKSWKYILVKDNLLKNCYRPKALRDFMNVKKDDFGGIVDGYHNLSQKGKCWVYYYAEVSGNAQVGDNARICGNAIVKENAKVFENAIVNGRTIVKGNMIVKGRTYLYDI